jgi:hypothetical protein
MIYPTLVARCGFRRQSFARCRRDRAQNRLTRAVHPHVKTTLEFLLCEFHAYQLLSPLLVVMGTFPIQEMPSLRRTTSPRRMFQARAETSGATASIPKRERTPSAHSMPFRPVPPGERSDATQSTVKPLCDSNCVQSPERGSSLQVPWTRGLSFWRNGLDASDLLRNALRPLIPVCGNRLRTMQPERRGPC